MCVGAFTESLGGSPIADFVAAPKRRQNGLQPEETNCARSDDSQAASAHTICFLSFQEGRKQLRRHSSVVAHFSPTQDMLPPCCCF